ncbi:uncharacterized protein [Acropora muricata]|uniref:uncharacterized protein n=1 Tax=Acropora muricata TaxID=159855 RepID=UPI0034E481B4
MERMFLMFFLTVAFLTLANCLPTREDEMYNDDVILRSLRLKRHHCGCVKGHRTCGCCLHLNLHPFHKKVQANVCINATEISSPLGMDFFMTWNKHVMFNKTITATGPPPVCFQTPFSKVAGKACVKFSKLSLEKNHIGGCADLELKALHFTKDFHLGCIFFKGHGTRTYLDKPLHNLLTGYMIPHNTADMIPRNDNLEYDALDLVRSYQGGCKCKRSPPHCDCCVSMRVFRLPINACAEADMDESETGFNVSISINRFKIISKHISVAGSPPICHRFHLFRNTEVCLKLTNVSFEPGRTGACLELDIGSSKTSMGCFYMKRLIDNVSSFILV